MSQTSPLSLDSLTKADKLIQTCFLQISEGNHNASFPDEACGASMTDFLQIMKNLEIQLTNIHSNFLQDEQKRITKEIEDLEMEVERKDTLIKKAQKKLTQWDEIFSEDPMNE